MTIIERALQRLRKDGESVRPSGLTSSVALGAETRFQTNALIVLPSLRFSPGDADAGFKAFGTDDGRFLSEIRSLKRAVLDATKDGRAQGSAPVIVVTSAVPGDGKSIISLSLARSLASERAMTPVLVDGDVARQQVSRLFDAAESGLANSLVDGTDPRSLIHGTSLPNLLLLPAGPNSESAAECFSSNRWEDAMIQMRQSGSDKVFIVDTAPVLAASEAQYAAIQADLVVFVIRAEVTPTQAVLQAIERLNSREKTVLVLNATFSSGSVSYYEYGSYKQDTHGEPHA